MLSEGSRSDNVKWILLNWEDPFEFATSGPTILRADGVETFYDKPPKSE
jgi:hypothetical protein